MNRQLVLTAIIKVRVHARWWIETHHARREEEGWVIGTELHRLGALFAIWPFHGDGWGKTMSLQVNAVVIRTQRVIDLKLVIFPGLWVIKDVLTLGIGDIRGKHLCLAIRQVIRHKVMGLDAEFVQTGAIEKRARAEAVIVRQGSIAKFGRLFQICRTRIGNHDDLAFVVDQAAESDREQYCYQRDVEDQVCQLTAITTFCGNRVRTRAVFFSRKFRDTPLLQPGFHLRAHLLKAALRLALGMHLHAV